MMRFYRPQAGSDLENRLTLHYTVFISRSKMVSAAALLAFLGTPTVLDSWLTTRRIVLVLLGVGLCLGNLWLRGGPHGRAEHLLESLREGIHQGQAGSLVNLLDQDYEIARHWPEITDIGAVLAQHEQTGVSDPSDHRQTLQRLLLTFFFRHRGQERSVHTTLHDLQPLGDGSGRYVAHISAEVAFPGHQMGRYRPPPQLERHRFVLQQRGIFFPAFFFVDHDPLGLP